MHSQEFAQGKKKIWGSRVVILEGFESGAEG
jgi:hypothetical protein